jgi:mevalonate kinase
MKVLAPGKLILSGEHAVVYGHPALAMAVNRYVTATATPQAAQHISFDLSDLSYQRRLSLTSLNSLKNRIKLKYQRFVNGDFKIRDVLQKPVELAQFAFSLFFEVLNIKLTQGIKIRVESTIPMGCGMGSSAATVLSIVHAIASHLSVEIPPEIFLRLGREAESMQHGYSSGLDLQVSMHGGCLFMQGKQIYQRAIPDLPLYLVNTGLPETSTGECVVVAADLFKTSAIGTDFAAVTRAMDQAFSDKNLRAAMDAIQRNHDLLVNINVVPAQVQQFIAEVEELGGAAKICGAGAVLGSKAGMVLVVTENEAELIGLCHRYHYPILPIAGETRGVHVS